MRILFCANASLLAVFVVSTQFARALPATRPATQPSYAFNGAITEQVLRSYLARAVTAMDLLVGRGDLPDNIRLLKSIGAKYAGRTVFLWGGEKAFTQKITAVVQNSAEVHRADPDIVLEACLFEAISKDVEQLRVPVWAYKELGRPIEPPRSFRFNDMRYADGRFLNNWRTDTAVPDITRPETQLWFYFLARSYIDAGIEAIHFGQVELMGQNDPELEHWSALLERVRAYAAQHARRHLLLCNGHVPSGGLVRDGRLLLDFHAMPLRIIEVAARPQAGELRVGYADSIFGRSKGGITPSGWTCPHLPYLVELDNWGASEHPGEAGLGGNWVFGYDEITWFAHQPEACRNDWIRYAASWVRDHGSAGYLQMPVSRGLASAVDGKDWYFANTASNATPTGFGQEMTIKSIWSKSAR